MLINGKNGGGNNFYRRVVAFNTDAESYLYLCSICTIFAPKLCY